MSQNVDFTLLSQEFIHSLSKFFLHLCLASGIVTDWLNGQYNNTSQRTGVASIYFAAGTHSVSTHSLITFGFIIVAPAYMATQPSWGEGWSPALIHFLFWVSGGAPGVDLRALSKDNVNMEISTLAELRRDALMVSWISKWFESLRSCYGHIVHWCESGVTPSKSEWC